MNHYVVVGNPVEHSQSPFIHAAFAQQTGQVMTYGRHRCVQGALAATLRELAEQGLSGCNITVPFKFEAWQLAARHTERATLAQAANTLRFDPQGWLADNTDGIGLCRDIEHNAGHLVKGQRLLLIGAGGAAAGVLGPLLAAGAAQVVVANRDLGRAQTLVERHLPAAGSTPLLARALADAGRDHDIVVNATASSLQGAAIPVLAEVLRPGTLAIDLMYGAPAQAFLDWARAAGAVGRDGLGMLVEQAAVAFELWRGVRPDTAPVLAALRLRLDAAAA